MFLKGGRCTTGKAGRDGVPHFRGLVAAVIDRDTLRGGIDPYHLQYLKLGCTVAEHAPPAWSVNFEINNKPLFLILGTVCC